ncbi:CarD family transcriptional regulator [Pleomorphochaeta sp. DL1XJH-081]|jgi:CarD family transcriptional regulator|uniref:CarD family transcriptional regulator n=1 Tax=Pleomorphochaeta sp. DL1XJH-081 TaxID=3409690 RepID=UPI003BB55E4D
MTSSEKNEIFALGDHVVYPLQGVGVINKIEEKTLRGNTSLYYEIFLEISDMTVMLPVDKVAELGIRSIVKPSEAMEAINSISNKLDQVPVDWKARYQMNVDLLSEGSIASIAKVVQILYHRSKIKELPVQERKLYDNALRILIDESALALGRPREEIEAMIFSKLEREPKAKES